MASPVPGSLEHLADAEPARVAIVGHERTLTRGEWDARACALADGLQEEFGLAAGDRVGIAMAPGPEYLEVTFALAKLGAAPVGIAPRDSDEVAARLVAADAELLIADDAALADAHGGLAIGGPAEDLIARHRRRDAPRRLSGTEAAPPSVTFDADGRALVHEHEPERLAAVGQALGALVTAVGIHAGDVHLFAAPTHLGASTLFAGVTLIAGGKVVATADPTAVTIARHGVTTAYLTRQQLATLAAVPDTIRALITTGPVYDAPVLSCLYVLHETDAGTVALQTPADREAGSPGRTLGPLPLNVR